MIKNKCKNIESLEQKIIIPNQIEFPENVFQSSQSLDFRKDWSPMKVYSIAQSEARWVYFKKKFVHLNWEFYQNLIKFLNFSEKKKTFLDLFNLPLRYRVCSFNKCIIQIVMQPRPITIQLIFLIRNIRKFPIIWISLITIHHFAFPLAPRQLTKVKLPASFASEF